MADQTTPKGYPYPADDETPDVPRDLRLLAEAVDAKVPRFAAGEVSGPSVNSGTQGTAAVTFPVGLFTAAPIVVAGSRSGNFQVNAEGVTATGFTMRGKNVGGSASTLMGSWIAMQA